MRGQAWLGCAAGGGSVQGQPARPAGAGGRSCSVAGGGGMSVSTRWWLSRGLNDRPADILPGILLGRVLKPDRAAAKPPSAPAQVAMDALEQPDQHGVLDGL